MSRKLVLTIAIVACTLLIVFLVSSRYLHGIPGPGESGRVPWPGPAGGNSNPVPAADFTLNDLDGNKVSLSDFRGRPVVLNFWATW